MANIYTEYRIMKNVYEVGPEKKGSLTKINHKKKGNDIQITCERTKPSFKRNFAANRLMVCRRNGQGNTAKGITLESNFIYNN